MVEKKCRIGHLVCAVESAIHRLPMISNHENLLKIWIAALSIHVYVEEVSLFFHLVGGYDFFLLIRVVFVRLKNESPHVHLPAKVKNR